MYRKAKLQSLASLAELTNMSALSADDFHDPATATGGEADANILPGLAAIRRGFATRRAHFSSVARLTVDEVRPQAGDLVLAEITSLGQHTRLELPDGRRSQLYVGDRIVVTYGNRYAPDQFEAEVPADMGPCHLVAAGGIASRLIGKHARVKAPTRIKPVGLLAREDGRALNLRDWSVEARSIPKSLPPVIVVTGTAMNAGKTTAAASLIKGLQYAGMRVGAAKVTGTGAGGDFWQMKDAGAVEVVDFTDAGYATTYQVAPNDVEKIFVRLLSHLGGMHLDAIVVEVADGVLQMETSELLMSSAFAFYCQRMIFAAGDALGALAGAQWLQQRGLRVDALSGAFTASPLAVREASTALGLPVLGKKSLSDPDIAVSLLSGRL